MASIYPIPTTRSSDQLARTRLVSQMQSDSLDLLRLQTQVSTGRRIELPSDDAPASQRAVVLQRLLELKAQATSNLNATRSYADATDGAVASVSELLTQVKATALGAVSNTTSAANRNAAVQEIRTAVARLTEVGNLQFRDRFLFGGSRTTTPPYTKTGDGYIAFDGNESRLRSFADIGLLYESNLSGADVFGAYSAKVRGDVDLNPVLQPTTLLADLRGGNGVTKGSISISDGNSTRIIDISGAETIGDVADLIAANPPAGRTIRARVTAVGLDLEMDAAGGGDLIVREVGRGTTAAELGIVHATASGVGPIVGGDLNPQLRLTTALSDTLGVRARAVIQSLGNNNDLVLEARGNGSASNGVTVQFVDDNLLHASPGLIPGNESVTYSATPVAARAALAFTGFNNNLILTASTPGTAFNNVAVEIADAGVIGNSATVTYNAGSKRLTIGVDSTGATDMQAIIDALAADGTFTATPDASDPADGAFSATTTISATNALLASANTGNSGGAARTIFVQIAPGGTTAENVVHALNSNSAVAAEFTAKLEPNDTSNAVTAGKGFVDVNASAATALGSGEDFDVASGIQIVNGGQTYTIDLTGVRTVEDLLNALNGSGAYVSASIGEGGVGIDVRSRLSGADFSIGENGGRTATQLGLRSFSATTLLSDLNLGRGVGTVSGTDFSIRRRDGVTLDIDLGSALTVQDVLDKINNDSNNLNPANRVTARLSALGNGIELIDSNTAGGSSLAVLRTFGSSAAVDLGLVPSGGDQANAVVSGTDHVLTGRDVNPIEVDGTFNTLLRLANAIDTQNSAEAQRLTGLLDVDIDRVNFARSDLAQRGRALDSIGQRLEDENVQLQDSLSKEIDVDLVKAISQLTARQASLQASLQLAGKTMQLTLLDFI